MLRSGNVLTHVEAKLVQQEAERCVALADAWPTPVLAMLTVPAAASTVTWEMGFVHLDRRTCKENDWQGYHSTVESAEASLRARQNGNTDLGQ